MHVYSSQTCNFAAIKALQPSIDSKKLEAQAKKLGELKHNRSVSKGPEPTQVKNESNGGQQVTLPKLSIAEDEPLESLISVQDTKYLSIRAEFEQAREKVKERAS